MMKNNIKNLPRTMERVLMQPWAITGDKMGQLSELLLSHVSGEISLTDSALIDGVDSISNDDDEPFFLAGAVAVIDVSGVIGKRLSSLEVFCGGCDVDIVKRAVKMALGDDRVQAIVLDIDSPGGMVTGTPELANFISDASEVKPIMAYTEMMMCSAAYWIGCACGEIFCSESAVVGSIGVVCAAVDQSECWKNEGYEALVFRSAGLKAAGGMTGEKWKAEWKAEKQKVVEDCAENFFQHVRNHRGGDLDDACFTGAVWDGDDLLELGLVDGFADTLDDFVQIVNIKLA